MIYWSDERKDRYEISNSTHLSRFKSVGKMVIAADLTSLGNGYYELATESATLSTTGYNGGLGLCSSEKFANQPVYLPTTRDFCTGSFCDGLDPRRVIQTGCTAVVVSPTLIATAGHCVGSADRVIFNFYMTSSNTAKDDFIATDEIFTIVSTVVTGGSTSDGSDWALLRLDRAVPSIVPIVPVRSSGTIASGANIYNISHSLGMPSKFVDDTVVNNSQGLYFLSHLQVFHGASGSPVFNATDHRLEGLVTAGPSVSLSANGNCMGYYYCLWGEGDSNGGNCDAVRVVRATTFAQAIALHY